jgi:uncharacterized membrane protein
MTQVPIRDRKLDTAMDTARMLYFAHGLVYFFTLGTLSVIPLIFNYGKRPESQGTIVYSHHGWMIRSFWWYLIWLTIALTVFIGTSVSYFLVEPVISPVWVYLMCLATWGLAWLWKGYRLIRGFVDLNNNRAMP